MPKAVSLYPDPPKDMIWHDLANAPLEGKGFADTASPFHRFPARAQKLVRQPVWDLSTMPAGLSVGFATNSSAIWARWRVPGYYVMTHFAPSGLAGLDLYVKHARQWRWLGVGRPERAPRCEARLIENIPARRREYRLYLPLYAGIASLEIGLDKGSTFATLPARAQKPIVFYGTSIVQGGCASRAGMVYSAILGRWLDWPTINLGFSGNGMMEPEIADLLAEIPTRMYVLDSLPNMDGKLIAQRAVPFVRTLRTAQPSAPIVLVENANFADAFLSGPRQEKIKENNRAIRKAYAQLKREGLKNLHLLGGDDLLGPDGEGTVDGVHATDLGFVRLAAAMKPLLSSLLRSGGRSRSKK